MANLLVKYMVTIKQESFGMLATNSYIVTDSQSRESVMIDCPKFNSRMKQFLTGFQIKYVLLTHAHFDHIAGCSKLLQQTDAKCLLSGKDAFMLNDPIANLSKQFFQKCDSFSVKNLEDYQNNLKIGETRIDVISTPGHTPGSVSYLIDNFLFTGDTLMASTVGKTDFPFGNDQDMLNSLRVICKLDNSITICPGHDEIATLEALKMQNPYVINMV